MAVRSRLAYATASLNVGGDSRILRVSRITEPSIDAEGI